MRGHAAEKAGARAGDFLSGKYLLEECLGIGGMGEVYRATNVSLGRKVAIKILNKEHTSNEEDVMRFLREARAAAAVRHPNVVDVFDVSRDDDGTPFIVQELLAGEDLEQYILGRGTCLSAEESLEIIIPVAEAVAAAHKQNVVHRDLKPANIFLAREGTNLIPKVLDFGAALYQTVGALSAKERKMLIGTPHYMAPEQITTATEVDQRADIWAIGVILYEMMVGETPFEAEDGAAVMKLVRTRSVQPLRKLVPLAPVSLEEIVVRCLDRDRRKRFADASDLRAELETVRAELKSRVRKRADTVPELDLPPPASTRPLLPQKRLSTKRRGSSVLTLSSPDEDVSWDIDPPRSASRPIEVAKPVRTAADVIRDAELAFASRPERTAADVIRDAEAASSSRPSSIPPVLDPRAASGSPSERSARSERGEKLPPSRPAFDSIDSADSSPSIDLDLDLEHTSADKARASQANREAPRESTSKEPSLTPALTPHRPPTPSVALRPQVEPERPFTRKESVTLLAWVTLPALVAFVALSFAPSVAAPLGHAMRGDSPLASGVLAVLTLVGAAVLAARSLGSSRSMGLLVATVGAVVLGVVMIIVTFSASESVALGIPPAAGSIVPFIAPIVPLGLAIAALKHARLYWFSRFEDDRTEARRYAYVAGVLVLALLELGPFGAVRAAGRTGAPGPATHQSP